jgi:hypothetical protein
MDKINYHNWYEGKAIHWSCEAYIPVNVEAQIIRFKWEDISSEDVIKIKAKQSDIFFKESSRILLLWKQIFESKISDYSNKEKYLSNELSDMRTILSIDERLNVVHHTKPFLNHKGLVFDEESLNMIRGYFHDVILLEKKRSFDFIHSKKFKYQHLTRTPCEIYAQVCWDFYNWLLKFNIEIGSVDIVEKSSVKKIENEIVIDNNNFISLLSIFENDQEKIDIVKKALNALNITKASSERQITAFIDASKTAGVLPLFKNLKLICAVYGELGKSIPKNIKSRTDGTGYKLMLKTAKKYYGLL